jgi:hypothetical protein
VSITGFLPDDGYDVGAAGYASRVTGDFTGTTDEIIQWGACKWGIADDVVRAMAVTESDWNQGVLDASGAPVPGSGYGDFSNDPGKCQRGYSLPCPQSFGLLQIKATTEPSSFPASRDSTAFNVDYTLMELRTCFEGWTTWLRQYPGGTTPYAAGDLWGCVGFWYSGDWYGSDGGAATYIDTVKRYDEKKPWLSWADESAPTPVGSTAALNDSSVGTGTNQFEYVGEWYYYNDGREYHGDGHVNFSQGDYFRIRFSGSQITIYGYVSPDGGTAGISIDGGPETPATFFAPVRAWQQVIWSSPALSAGAHVVRVRNTSPGLAIEADRADVS